MAYEPHSGDLQEEMRQYKVKKNQEFRAYVMEERKKNQQR